MQTNAELQAEVTALRTQLADGSARMSEMKAELANANARPNTSLSKKVCEPPAEVVVVQAQAKDTAADRSIDYITYGPWRPDGTRSSYGLYNTGFWFKSDGYPARMKPRKQTR
jgi:hypothetical protein